MRERLTAIFANTATLYRAGARLVCSSDAGVGPNKPHTALPHGVTTFLPSIGMTNAEAITNVTAFAAEVCGVADRTGTLEPGKDADILAVAGNPLDDLNASTKSSPSSHEATGPRHRRRRLAAAGQQPPTRRHRTPTDRASSPTTRKHQLLRSHRWCPGDCAFGGSEQIVDIAGGLPV